jgi:antitoxin MazE
LIEPWGQTWLNAGVVQQEITARQIRNLGAGFKVALRQDTPSQLDHAALVSSCEAEFELEVRNTESMIVYRHLLTHMPAYVRLAHQTTREDAVKVQVKKWGNSASVRIPASVMAASKLSLDQVVDVREEDGRIVIEPLRAPTYDLDQLLDQMTPETFHEETDFGPPVGQEAW